MKIPIDKFTYYLINIILMKPILLLVIFVIFFTSSVHAIPSSEDIPSRVSQFSGLRAGSFKEIQITDPLEPMFVNLLEFGAEMAIKKLQKENLTSAELTFAPVPNSIYLQVGAGFNVKFDIDFFDRERKKNFNVNFVVFYQPWTSIRKLVSVSNPIQKN